MAKWNFTANNGQLIATLTPVDGDVQPRTYSFKEASIEMAVGKIKYFESGVYRFATLFTEIGTIDGNTPSDLIDAKNKIIALIPSSGGGSSSSYNTVVAYDTVADLPITFSVDTIHSISILSITGETVIEIDGEQTTLVEGQSTSIEADGLIDVGMMIISCTGTFLATTVS